MSQTISATATTEREAARRSDGKFGPHATNESDVALVEHASPGAAPDPEVFRQRYDTMTDKLAAYHDELEKNVAGLAEDDNWNDYLDAMSRFHRYSPSNQMLIAIQTDGEATRVAGFRTWKKLDRNVRKGEKGISILAPKVVRADVLDAAGNTVHGADGKPIKEKRCVGFTTTSVFDISQTDGKPLPELEELTEEPREGLTQDLQAAISDSGFELDYTEIAGSAQGYTTPSGKVVVDSRLSEGERARTLAHELGHIKLGHLERISEYHQGHGGQRGVMEVEADSYAYSMLRANGMSSDSVNPSSYYVAGWSRSDPDVLRGAAENVSKAVRGTLESHSFRNVEPAPGREADA